MMRLTFHGAAGTVTGSRHLLETHDKRFLVDCGLFQGTKENRLKNWDPLPFDPASLDEVFLTHAHIDHSGALPLLVKQGFQGSITGTTATMDLARILLPDTGHLQEEEAKYARKKGYSKHANPQPLFTREDAEHVFPQLNGVPYGQHFHPASQLRGEFRDTGHILGAGFLDLKSSSHTQARKIVFTGDLGRPFDAILRPPAQAYNVDYLVMESTYGDRLHDEEDPESALVRVIKESMDRGGLLLIPAFSVGRTQTLLYLLRKLEIAGKIPELPIYLDSPMAIEALRVHQNHIPDLNLQCRKETLRGDRIFHPAKLSLTPTVQDSKKLNKLDKHAIIIAGSGMATGGRILHHLKERLPESQHTVLFIGYQAQGTRGRTLLEGKEEIKMFGTQVPVNAKIDSIQAFSGHADYEEMLAWLMGCNVLPKRIFLVHGEPEAANSLADKIRSKFKCDVSVPQQGDSFLLDF